MTTSVLVVALAGTVGSRQASATSLQEAMVAAYQSNTRLKSARLQTRVIDENVPQALSGYRPKVVGDAFYGRSARREEMFGTGASSNETYGYGLSIEQPLFDGFRTKNAVLEAESEVQASRQDLRATENEVLFQTATAYLNVIRDEGVVLYRRKNLTALRRALIGVQERLKRGQVTVTDLEQAKLRAARAQSELDLAIGNLKKSTLQFTRVTQLPPKGLRMPRLPGSQSPKSLRVATQIAERNSPIIASAKFKADAAVRNVSKIKGELLPSVNLLAGYDRSFNSSDSLNEDGFSVVGRVRVPLYQGGAVSARVRQAQHTAANSDVQIRDARLQIGQSVAAAWAEIKAAKARVKADREAIKASEQALAGLKEEYKLGRRTVLQLLDAEKELVDARIQALQSQRDRHVSAYALLRSTGELVISRMAAGTEQYEPERYYNQVRNKWWGTAAPTTVDEHLTSLGSTTDAQILPANVNAQVFRLTPAQNPSANLWNTTIRKEPKN